MVVRRRSLVMHSGPQHQVFWYDLAVGGAQSSHEAHLPSKTTAHAWNPVQLNTLVVRPAFSLPSPGRELDMILNASF